MHAQIRLAHSRATRFVLVSQKRLLATPPVPPRLPPSPSPAGGQRIPTVAVPTSSPGTSTLATPPASALPPHPVSTLPPAPPPPPPPRRPRRQFRRFLLYTSLGVLTFYPLSGWLSTQNETYRDFFTGTIPGGEFVADYADDHAWESFGYGTVSKKAVEGWYSLTGEEKKPASPRETVEVRARQIRQEVESEARKAGSEARRLAAPAKSKATTAERELQTKAEQAQDVISSDTKAAETKTVASATSLRDRAVAATLDAADKTNAVAAEAKAKVIEATSSIPFNFSDGVEGIVREAERALRRGEVKVEDAVIKAEAVDDPTSTPRGYLDTQRPRELRPETVTPQKPTFEGQTIYAGSLPVGHEPPPGYYIPPPASSRVKDADEKAKDTLPLLAPKVREFAGSEPIISQLASTIDSLTTSLSTPTSGSTTGILTKAHDDLSALSQRLDDVKKVEKDRLERTMEEKTKEFETLLRSKEEQRAKGEQGLKEGWDKERGRMVNDWRSSLESELERQRQGIEQRLREEVVSQGIELQRRWLRSIKTQVETERGGRLAKLDQLTTSLKQLERITLDNSATLDDNVRLHKVWSALRAVQAKADTGDRAFDDELRVLRSISSPNGDVQTVITAILTNLETFGIAQTGVKSFASLSSWFTNSVSPRCQSASLVPAPQDASVISHIASTAISRVLFSPKAGLVEGDDVSSVLARAEWCLGEKDLDGAAREVNSLKGWTRRLASDWLREARRRLEVMQALEVVGAEATLASLLMV